LASEDINTFEVTANLTFKTIKKLNQNAELICFMRLLCIKINTSTSAIAERSRCRVG